MKKKLAITATVFIACTITISVISNNKETSYQDDNLPIVRKQENTLSMMIEQTAGAGDYKLETRSSWPTSGYTFNTTLSKCENGSTLSWDDTNKKVRYQGRLTDKCYVYFDIVTVPTITSASVSYYNVDITTGYLKINYQSYYEITEYYVSINEGNYRNYTISSTGSYVFFARNGVAYCKGDEMNIKVYIKDINGNTSDIYTIPTYIVTSSAPS